jgi:hypothetical protein
MTQLYLNGVMFVSTPVAHVRTTATIQLNVLITACRSLNNEKNVEEAKFAPAVVEQQINSYLARRPHIDQLFVFADERLPCENNSPIFQACGMPLPPARGWGHEKD